jgi:beta-galactosidase
MNITKKAVVCFLLCGLFAAGRTEAADFGELTAANGKKFALKIAGEQKAYQLIVYSDTGEELGFYPVVDKPERVEGNAIIFGYAVVDGNAIIFKSGPPKTVELDTAQVVFQTGAATEVPMVGKKLPVIERKPPDPAKEAVARKRLGSREWNRVVEGFNQGWIFALADERKGETAEQIPPARWRRVDLPHDWGVEHPAHGDYISGNGGGFTKTGLGWYKKTFTVPDPWKDRRVFIDFGGIYMNSDVWINGQWLGHRPYGFSSFRYDLTPYLAFGGPNEITVRVDNSIQRNARWYTGSGIYRDVKLVVTDPVHVANWGTSVQTPKVSEKEGTVSLKTIVVNSTDKAQKVIIRATVAGQKTEAAETIPALGQKEVSQTLTVPNPRLWSVEEPNLYSVETGIVSDGKTLDQYRTPFGFRTLGFDGERGFLLNGKPVKLKGVCVHEDGGGAVGTAVPVDVWERRFKILQEMGCNAVRCSHNPFFAEFYDLADRMGMLVIAEAFDEWKMGKREHGYADYFDQWAETDLKDMLRRDRNHPSIIMWSIGNEIRDVGKPGGAETAAWLCNIVKSMDTTRPTTIGLNHVPRADDAIYDAIDQIGVNFGHWGDGHKDTGPSKYDRAHADHPGRFIYGSETTHSFQTRGVYKTQTFRNSVGKQPNLADKEIFDFNASYNSSYDNAFVEHHNRFTLAYMRDHDWMAGEFRWTGIDYLGESWDFPSRFKDFGVIDMCGFPKDSYYLYQSVWTDKTVLHILPHWNWPGMEGTKIPVWVYANQCDEVELFVNGVSAGRQLFDLQKLYVSWDVPYAPGELRAVSYKAGKKVKEMVARTAGKPASIELVPDRTRISPNHRDVVHAQVRILDADGNVVPTAANRITFSVDGPARILGVDNGDQLDHDPLKADSRKAFHGMCLALIQSGFETGEVTIRAESEGLQGAAGKVMVEGASPAFSHHYSMPPGMTYGLSEFELALNVGIVAPSTPGKRYLSVRDAASATCGWKEACDNKAISGGKMAIGGRVFQYGIGTHSRSETIFELKGDLAGYDRLTGFAGPDDRGAGAMEFKILLDGRQVFDSGKVSKATSKPMKLDIDLKGAEKLVLVVGQADDGTGRDHADWAELALESEKKEGR